MKDLKKKLYKNLLIIGLLGGLLHLTIWICSPWFKLGFNISNSVDGFFFIIVKGKEISKGELMAFYPPPSSHIKNIWFVKYAVGVAGEQVTWWNNKFFINGSLYGQAKNISSDGKTTLYKNRVSPIPQNHYFVWSPHPNSYDSRYQSIGMVPQKNVIGRAFRIF